MSERIWISWTRQRRNEGVSSGIGAQLYTFPYEKYKYFRYPLSGISTLWALVKERPRICCAMLPSIFCAALLALVKAIFRYKLLIDLHTLNVYYLLGEGNKKTLYDLLLRYSLNRADLIIVSNEYYARKIEQPVNKTFVLPDAIPDTIKCSQTTCNKPNDHMVFCICSYDPDEPYEELFTAASHMADIEFFFSGDFRVVQEAAKELPDLPNIHYTGFLPYPEYESLLCLADTVVVTTKLEGCLCCGAYEALAAGKPLVLSSTQALQHYFGDGPVYTDNNAIGFEGAIRTALSNKKKCAYEVQKRAKELKEDWNIRVNKLNILLEAMIP